MSKKNLLSVAVGDSGIIDTLSSTGIIRRRLLDLGITTGAEITCLFEAPSGNPRAYLIRSTVIALRNQDARQIILV